ncbi:Rho termination factor N-terminal domain-containing protein [Ornithinimicrobium sp. LYQ92]|uniref:Rho termination factor N-terminal domain-containing protein n=1 Tax=Serinicoccus sp. LYQ92 TaxID=3378798 RepID=UPI0038532DB1
MPSNPKLVKVYRKSTGQRLKHPMNPADLRYNPDLAVVPSHRDAAAAAAPDDLDSMKVDALRNLAAEQGADVPAKARKADIIAAIQTSPDLGEQQTQPTHNDPTGSDTREGARA